MGAAPKNSPGLCEVWPAVPRSKTPTVGGAGCTRGFPDSGLPAVLSPRVHLRMRGRGVVWASKQSERTQPEKGCQLPPRGAAGPGRPQQSLRGLFRKWLYS